MSSPQFHTVHFSGGRSYSVAAITDASGAVVERSGYDAYGDSVVTEASGTPLAGNESSIGNAYRFTGRRLDSETGLSYFRARYMDHKLGRFVGRDPGGSTFERHDRLRSRLPAIARAFGDRLALVDPPFSGKGYTDGMGLYAAYFVPRRLDPYGLYCTDYECNSPCDEGDPDYQACVKEAFDRYVQRIGGTDSQVEKDIWLDLFFSDVRQCKKTACCSKEKCKECCDRIYSRLQIVTGAVGAVCSKLTIGGSAVVTAFVALSHEECRDQCKADCDKCRKP